MPKYKVIYFDTKTKTIAIVNSSEGNIAIAELLSRLYKKGVRVVNMGQVQISIINPSTDLIYLQVEAI